jgi:anti-anti-sigma factor
MRHPDRPPQPFAVCSPVQRNPIRGCVRKIAPELLAQIVSLGLEDHFRIEVSSSQARSVLTLLGELDLASAPALEQELDEVEDRGCVVVDMRKLEFIDSTGLRVLIKAHQRATETDRKFAILSPDDGQVRQLLDLTGARDRLNIADDPEEPASAE